MVKTAHSAARGVGGGPAQNVGASSSAAEITMRMDRDPREIYRELTPEFGAGGISAFFDSALTLYLQGPRTYTTYWLW
jgi:hypothetical protein